MIDILEIRKLFLVYLSMFTGFINLGNFATSNPSLFLISLILCSKKIKNLIINKLISISFIFIFGSLIALSNGINNIDQRFLLTLICTIAELILVENLALRTISISKDSLKILYFKSAKLILFISLIMILLNIFNLHCLIFRCREFGPLGMSLMSAEPSYVGIYGLMLISFSILSRQFLNNRMYRIILSTGIISCLLSRSLLSIGAPFFITTIAILPSIKKLILNIIKNKKLLKKSFYGVLFIFLIFGLIYFYDNNKNLIFEIEKIWRGANFSNFFSKESIQVFFIVSGRRLAYLFASFSSKVDLLISGHGLFSSSFIFQENIEKVFQNFQLGLSQEKLLTDERVFGAKPHSLLGMIIFSNGFTGLFILFRREFKNFFKTIFDIYNFQKLEISKIEFKKYWFNILPIIILFYPSTNTDPFKFICLYFYYIYFYGNKFKNE